MYPARRLMRKVPSVQFWFALLFIAVLIPLVIAAVLLWTNSAKALIGRTERNIRLSMDQFLSIRFEQMDNLMNAGELAWRAAHGDLERRNEIFSRYWNSIGTNTDLVVIDSTCHVMGATAEDAGLLISNDQMELDLQHKGIALLPGDSPGDYPSLVAWRPARATVTENTPELSAIIAVMGPEWIRSIAGSFSTPVSFVTTIVDEDTRTAIRVSREGELSTFNCEGEPWAHDHSIVYASRKLHDSPASPMLVISVPRADVVAQIRTNARYSVFALVLVHLTVFPIAGYIAAHKIVRPISGLARVADELAAGDFSVRYSGDRGFNAASELIESFDHMAMMLQERTDELRDLTLRDPLTGLFNRRCLEMMRDVLDEEESLPTTVVMADVNGLQMINDSLGHSAGDRLLVSIADIIKDCSSDKGVAMRWGGDEFVVVMPGATDAEGTAMMRSIKAACEKAPHDPAEPSVALGLATRTSLDETLAQAIADAESRMYTSKYNQSRSIRGSSIHALYLTLAATTHETNDHSDRLANLSMKLARAGGAPESLMEDLRMLCNLHDIGKVGIPTQILTKPGPLSAEEWAIMKSHPEIGAGIVKASHGLAHISDAVLHHHERWDGKGYPWGISGKDIPLLSRMLSVVDSYDAMTNDRPYRKAFTHEEAVAEILRCSGTQFDPELTELFVRLVKTIES